MLNDKHLYEVIYRSRYLDGRDGTFRSHHWAKDHDEAIGLWLAYFGLCPSRHVLQVARLP